MVGVYGRLDLLLELCETCPRFELETRCNLAPEAVHFEPRVSAAVVWLLFKGPPCRPDRITGLPGIRVAGNVLEDLTGPLNLAESLLELGKIKAECSAVGEWGALRGGPGRALIADPRRYLSVLLVEFPCRAGTPKLEGLGEVEAC